MNLRPSVLIADAHSVVAQALADALGTAYNIVGVLSELGPVESAVRETCPSVVLLDVAFGTRSAIPTIHRLKQASPQSKVVILSAFTEQVVVEAARAAGAVAFVDKRLPLSELLCALSAAIAGHVFVSHRS